MNNINTLKFWHKLEHFYPYEIKISKSENIKPFFVQDEADFPNFSICEHADKYVDYYNVYCGIFPVSKAMEIVEKKLSNFDFRENNEDESCYCKFSLTVDGHFNAESFKISSYPWAIHRIKDGKVIIDKWDDEFNAYCKDMLKYFNEINTPLTYKDFEVFREKMIGSLNWEIDFSKTWVIIEAVLSEQVFSNKTEDIAKKLELDEIIKDNDLLNSFYVKDLERLIHGINRGLNSDALTTFLEHSNNNRIDIENDYDEIRRIMNPEFLPLGSWPSNYGLRFMQQLDINLFVNENMDLPVFSVNGPPGTGKTTLLKNIVAAIVVERAKALANLSAPDEAFEAYQVGYIRYKENNNWIYKLKEEYSRFGMFVLSNNNGAVENISKELPALDGLPDKYKNKHTYLNKVSDNIFGKNNSWAMLSAVLGNTKNRQKFIDNFWPIGKDDANIYRLQNHMANNDNKNWDSAKEQFWLALKSLNNEIEQLKIVYNHTTEYWEIELNLQGRKRVLDERRLILQSKQKEIDKLNKEIDRLSNIKIDLMDRKIEFESVDSLIKLKAYFTIIFKNARSYAKIRKDIILIINNIFELENEKKELMGPIEKLEKEVSSIEKEIDEIERELSKLKDIIDNFKNENEQELSFIDYFNPNLHDIASKSSPYGYKKLNEKREELFFIALNLHEEFVLSSKKMKSNLDAFNKWMRNLCTYQEKENYSKTLLDSFLMVVPVISSTFASVGTFLKDIKNGEIPYVFIDEAGQGLPQSAAGIIWRAKKSIIVGDPIQIEPISTIHNRIIESLKTYFQQDEIIASKLTSVQSLADLSNPYVGYRKIGDDKKIVGAPLIVHSRCKRTVFNIANEIAYDNKMIFASLNGDKEERFEWIDVQGKAYDEGHYVEEQAKEIFERLSQYFIDFKSTMINKVPSIYIISPFRTVKFGLKRYLRKELNNMYKHEKLQIGKKDISFWINNNIGTIHTFQGKEADIVFLCLGVDSYKQKNGAVSWASQAPNILNVAITRAKKELFIVGDKKMWGKLPYFDVAAKTEKVG